MARKKKASKSKIQSRPKEVGVDKDARHLWETGRPLLVGDAVSHGRHGDCVLVSLSGEDAVIKKKGDRDSRLTVPVVELTMTFDQLIHLDDPKWSFTGGNQ